MITENSQRTANGNIESVQRYTRGAELIFANAEALYDEAQILRQAGSFARAAVLHQISMEECSKINTLGAVSMTTFLDGDSVCGGQVS